MALVDAKQGELETEPGFHKMFFYGTLKKNEPNEEKLINHNAKFVGKAVTVDKWPLTVATNANIPMLFNKRNYGKNIHGEIYLVDQATKDFLDEFEGIHDDFYSCQQIQVKETETGTIHEVNIYMIDRFSEDIINENTILLDNYSSKNPYFPEYIKHLDRSDNTANLVSQIKSDAGAGKN